MAQAVDRLKVAISQDFFSAFARIPRAQQKKVNRFVSDFRDNPRSSGINYELDRLLRGGVQRELTRRHKGNALRQVKLRVGAVDPDGPSA